MNIPLMTAAALDAIKSLPHAPEPDTAPCWADLVVVEPRLRELEALAIGLHRKQDDAYAWGTIKLALCLMVGWEARKFPLRTATAYDVAYDHLLRCFETGKP